MSAHAKKIGEELLAKAGITPNGDKPWDVQVHNDDLYARVIRQGSLGLGESHMDGWWDVEKLDEFMYRVLAADLRKEVRLTPAAVMVGLQSVLVNKQRKSNAFTIGEKHYDIGNDVYRAMLDDRLVYTCGYWKDAQNLNEAQEAKLDLVCQKIGLEKGMKVLDIGCGWGSFAKYAAERYGAAVDGVTVSKEQQKLGMELCAGLPIDIQLKDYRDITGKYDRIVSLGMFEHVGYKNYETYMKVARAALKEDGLFLLHTIGTNASAHAGDAWMEKYIFPGGMLPSIAQIGEAIEHVFVMEDWHNFGAYYDATLMAWFSRFDQAWPSLKDQYDERFYRMWKFYLLSCAASFRNRNIQLWQIVLSPRGVKGGYSMRIR